MDGVPGCVFVLPGQVAGEAVKARKSSCFDMPCLSQIMPEVDRQALIQQDAHSRGLGGSDGALAGFS